MAWPWTVWCVTFADQEKNFRSRLEAERFLRAFTHDERVSCGMLKRCRGAYTYFGPAPYHLVANIDRLQFTPIRCRKVKRKRAPQQALVAVRSDTLDAPALTVDAVDPHVDSTGTPTPRENPS